MRKWTVPLTVLGLGGIGAMLMSDRGRQLFRSALTQLTQAPKEIQSWTDAAQQELERIQTALNELESALHARSIG